MSDNVTTFQKKKKNGEIILDKSKVANAFNNFFENTIHSLRIKANKHSNENYGLKNPVEIDIKVIEPHSSINPINQNITKYGNFLLLPTEQEGILKQILNLDNGNNLFLLAISTMYQISVVLF